MVWRLLALKGRALSDVGDPVGAKQAFSEAAAVVKRVGDSIRDQQLKRGFFASPQVASVLERSE
jgi:hypothetical protein